jgi:hypothetical protein
VLHLLHAEPQERLLLLLLLLQLLPPVAFSAAHDGIECEHNVIVR